MNEYELVCRNRFRFMGNKLVCQQHPRLLAVPEAFLNKLNCWSDRGFGTLRNHLQYILWSGSFFCYEIAFVWDDVVQCACAWFVIIFIFLFALKRDSLPGGIIDVLHRGGRVLCQLVILFKSIFILRSILILLDSYVCYIVMKITLCEYQQMLSQISNHVSTGMQIHSW